MAISKYFSYKDNVYYNSHDYFCNIFPQPSKAIPIHQNSLFPHVLAHTFMN